MSSNRMILKIIWLWENYQYHYFRTVMPSFDDPKLVSLLEANQVTIQAQEERTS